MKKNKIKKQTKEIIIWNPNWGKLIAEKAKKFSPKKLIDKIAENGNNSINDEMKKIDEELLELKLEAEELKRAMQKSENKSTVSGSAPYYEKVETEGNQSYEDENEKDNSDTKENKNPTDDGEEDNNSDTSITQLCRNGIWYDNHADLIRAFLEIAPNFENKDGKDTIIELVKILANFKGGREK